MDRLELDEVMGQRDRNRLGTSFGANLLHGIFNVKLGCARRDAKVCRYAGI